MKPINAFLIVLAVFVLGRNVINNASAERIKVAREKIEPTFIYDNELIICTNSGCY